MPARISKRNGSSTWEKAALFERLTSFARSWPIPVCSSTLPEQFAIIIHNLMDKDDTSEDGDRDRPR